MTFKLALVDRVRWQLSSGAVDGVGVDGVGVDGVSVDGVGVDGVRVDGVGVGGVSVPPQTLIIESFFSAEISSQVSIMNKLFGTMEWYHPNCIF